MDNLLKNASEYFSGHHLMNILIVVVTVFAGLFLVKLLQKVIIRTLKGRVSEQLEMVIKKTIFYSGLIIVVLIVFNQLGFKLTAVLGAAGIAGIAVGFAAQTSVSNIISGLFLISENAFSVGDLVEVNSTKGTVLGIDLLSVKIRTFDNCFVRVPNEVFIKSQVVNYTRFPVRRVDVEVGISYSDDIEKVNKLLIEIARANSFCLDDPEPIFILKGFGSSSIDIILGLWCVKEDFLKLRNSMIIDIKKGFDAEGIEIPLPYITVTSGKSTEAVPLNVNMKSPG